MQNYTGTSNSIEVSRADYMVAIKGDTLNTQIEWSPDDADWYPLQEEFGVDTIITNTGSAIIPLAAGYIRFNGGTNVTVHVNKAGGNN